MPLLTLESGGKWVVNAFSSFEQKRLILYRKYREIVNFSSFSTFRPLYNGNIPIKPWWRLITILWRLFQNKNFPKFIDHSGPMTSSWPPKTHFFDILSNFLQIFTFLTTLTWKLSHKTRVEIVHNTLEIVSNKIFPKFFDHSCPMMSFWPQKMHFFNILSKILQISTFLTTSTWKLFHKTMVEIIHNTLEIIPKSIFPKIFWPIWPYDVILTPKMHFFDILSKFLQISTFS